MTEPDDDTKKLASLSEEDEDHSKEAAVPGNGPSDDASLMPNAELLKRLPPEARRVVETGMSMH